MKNKQLDHEKALEHLHTLISQVHEPYLKHEFNEWVNSNLYKVEVQYVYNPKDKNIDPEFYEYHTNEILLKKLMAEASTTAKEKDPEYFTYPPMRVKMLSMMILGKKNS